MPTTASKLHPFFASKQERQKLQAEVAPPKKLDVTVDEHHAPEKKPARSRKKDASTKKDTTAVVKPARVSKKDPKKDTTKSKPRAKKTDEDDAFHSRICVTGERRATRQTATKEDPEVMTISEEEEVIEPDLIEAIDPNEGRRKRRKKSPGESQGSQASTLDTTDAEMREAAPEEVDAPTATTTATEEAVPSTEVAKEPKKEDPKPVKPTHWFFGGKPKKPDPPPVEKPPTVTIPPQQERKRFFKSKEELDAEATATHAPPMSPTSTKIFKICGLLDAPWPNREQCHVRGLDAEEHGAMEVDISVPVKSTRKLKAIASGVSAEEDLLGQQIKRLSIPARIAAINSPSYYEEEYFAVSPNIRLPSLRFLTGLQLQKEVRPRLSASVPPPGRTPAHRTARLIHSTSASASDSDCSQSEMSDLDKPSLIVALPARRQAIIPILSLYTRLLTTLTPHDTGEAESQLWTAKYAPQDSASILQPRRETALLRNWLSSLRVEATENMAQAEKRHKKETAAKKRPKKKRKRNPELEELADFLVDDDLLEEVTDPEDDILYGSASGLSSYHHPLTAAVNGRGFPTLGGTKKVAASSAILITGPHGCGKTASVYAVAKELGYTVFEINPGTRRSGKDILDQVGQMSKNHLVHQAHAPASFFGGGKGKGKEDTEDSTGAGAGKKGQQQSLILLEEVDVLFASDQHFWTTVLSLLSTSKRPVVLTATSPDSVPLDTLPLHTTLHFNPPDADTAVDYLLLLAANEGHLLSREAVETVYKSTGEDLRQSIMELEFWCQRAVGDRRAGLDWWPPAGNVGRKAREWVRPVSVGTVVGGVGMVYGPELGDGVGLGEAEVATAVWRDWGEEGEEQKEQRLACLDAWLVYADSLSDSAIFQKETFIHASFAETPLDPTAPKLPTVEPDDLLGEPYLKATPLVTPQTPFRELLVATTRSLAISTLRHSMGVSEGGLTNEDAVKRVLNDTDDYYPMLKYADSVIRNHLEPLFAPSSSSASYTNPIDCYSAATIATSIGPYVRRVIRHEDKVLEKKNSLLSTGGRKTRAARSALLGEAGLGHRGRRGDRWWNVGGSLGARVGGGGWGELEGRWEEEERGRVESEREEREREREERERLAQARAEVPAGAGEDGEVGKERGRGVKVVVEV
ncbi:hypothetical protein BJ508DRAFT_365525 [Ascobolus immersus RN42]|uniref:AAA+ ATPase domain-containing protein n=1 Tax=Ascobolus immersus RN42 TaxID=1160509 RepID=A0A3N4HPD5_ASCIM|nr:hypothetical protein BJ508DRAFT_365525 [Ascobolus immersus RN42]